MTTLTTDHRYFENKFKPEIEKHLLKALPFLIKEKFIKISPSSEYEDSNLSFDLLFGLNFQVSVRIRKSKYLHYKDMTIRHRSMKGRECEIDKIKKGYGQVYFYAYMNETETDLVKVRIVDVDVIREMIFDRDYEVKKNTDGTELASFLFSKIFNRKGNIYQFDI
jgi:hypothetical protein